jgi:hypothetical protein
VGSNVDDSAGQVAIGTEKTVQDESRKENTSGKEEGGAGNIATQERGVMGSVVTKQKSGAGRGNVSRKKTPPPHRQDHSRHAFSPTVPARAPPPLFPTFHSTPFPSGSSSKALFAQDPAEWQQYGVADVQRLMDHFGEKFTAAEKENVKGEFAAMKDREKDRLRKKKNTSEVLKMMMTLQIFSAYPILRKLALFALLIPSSTAWVERGFSIMKIIKTERRNALGEEMLSALIMVKMNLRDGLPSEVRDRAIERWASEKRRRGIKKSKDLKDIASLLQKNMIEKKKKLKTRRYVNTSGVEEEEEEDSEDDLPEEEPDSEDEEKENEEGEMEEADQREEEEIDFDRSTDDGKGSNEAEGSDEENDNKEKEDEDEEENEKGREKENDGEVDEVAEKSGKELKKMKRKRSVSVERNKRKRKDDVKKGEFIVAHKPYLGGREGGISQIVGGFLQSANQRVKRVGNHQKVIKDLY